MALICSAKVALEFTHFYPVFLVSCLPGAYLEQTMAKLTKSDIDSVIPEQNKFYLWDEGDGSIKGFGLVAYPSGQKSYVFQYRDKYGRTQRMTLGKHGDLTPDKARKIAKRFLKDVQSGADPAGDKKQKRKALTVEDLLAEYLKSEKFAAKAETTRKVDKGRINHHLRPLLGKRIIETLTAEDVRRAFAAIRDGKTAADVKTGYRGRARVTGGEGAARMAIRVLRAIFAWGMEQSLVRDNPAKGIKLGQDGHRNAIISTHEGYATLFQTIKRLETEHRLRQPVADCIRVLALTGARLSEMAALRWAWVDLKRGVITLPPAAHKTGKKTGSKEITLPTAAQEIIARQPDGLPEQFVFTPAKGTGPLSLKKAWPLIRLEAALPADMGIHGLRHSLATLMATQGAAAPEIMAALGHKQMSTAARYIKTVEDARHAVMEKHTAGISAALKEKKLAVVLSVGKASV